MQYAIGTDPSSVLHLVVLKPALFSVPARDKKDMGSFGPAPKIAPAALAEKLPP